MTNFTTGDVTELGIPSFLWTGVPVPTLTIPQPVEIPMPYVAFGPEGRLQEVDSIKGPFKDLDKDVVSPLARGGIFLEQDENAPKKPTYKWVAPDVAERPAGNSTNNYNLVVIDHVTGRGRIVRPEIP